MPTESQYVKQFWPSLAQLTGRQIGQGELGASALQQVPPQSSFAPAPAPVREFGKREFGPEAPVAAGAESALESVTKPAAVPSISARANPPEAPADTEGSGKSFWKLTEEMSDEDKNKILKDFEDTGLDVEGKFKELVDSRDIDPGLIKKGKDGKLDKKDMGLFLMEFGLRTMAAGGQTKDYGAALGSAALGTMEARRERGKEKDMKSRLDAESAYERSKDAQSRKERGAGAVAKEQERRDSILQKQAELEMEEKKIREMREERADARASASGDRSLDRDAMNERARLDRENRLSIEAERAAAREDDKRAITDAKVAELVAERAAELDGSMISKVNGKSWSKMTQAEKDAYLKKYATDIRSTFGAGRDVKPGGSDPDAPSWAQ